MGRMIAAALAVVLVAGLLGTTTPVFGQNI
jgi:hypothetical protein